MARKPAIAGPDLDLCCVPLVIFGILVSGQRPPSHLGKAG